MKKILISIILSLTVITSITYAAPSYRLERSIFPELNDTYDLGTTTQKWRSVNATTYYGDGSNLTGITSGGGTWGSITGTLSDQTDLQSALDLRVPYTGAIYGVDLNTQEFRANKLGLGDSTTLGAFRGIVDINQTGTPVTIADVTATDTTLYFNYGSGAYSTAGYYYSFNVYAYKTVNGTRIYSAYPLNFSGTDDNTSGAFYMGINWDASSDPAIEGYRVEVVQDDYYSYGAYNSYYIDTPYNYFSIGQSYTGYEDNTGQYYTYEYPVTITPTTGYIPTIDHYIDASGNWITTNNFIAQSFIKTGGSSSEFLKADGSSDSNSYLTGESDPYAVLSSGARTGATSQRQLFTNGIQTTTINGGSAANDDITIQGTSNSTRATSYVNLQPNGGFTGIGLTAPAYKLHIKNTVTGTPATNPKLFIEDTSATGYPEMLTIEAPDTSDPAFRFKRVTSTAGNYEFLVRGYGGAAGYNYLSINSYDKRDTQLVIHSNGNVGIGATAPGYQLEVKGTGAATDGLLINTSAYTSVPSPGTLADKVLLNPRGFSMSTDGATLTSYYRPELGIAVAANRYGPVLALKNNDAYAALAIESGRIGIRTQAPTHQIEVIGTGAASDGIAINTGAYTSVANPGATSNAILLTPRGFTMTTDNATISSGYQPELGIGVAVNRPFPAMTLKNGATYTALAIESGFIAVGKPSGNTPVDVNGVIRTQSLGGTTYETFSDFSSTYYDGYNNYSSGGIDIYGVQAGVGYGLNGGMRWYAGADTDATRGWAWNSNGVLAKTTLAASGAQMVLDKLGNLIIGGVAGGSQLTVSTGDVYVASSTRGIILKSPDGTCARGTISDLDVLTFSSITCP